MTTDVSGEPAGGSRFQVLASPLAARVSIRSELPPVSLQARRVRIQELKASLSAAVAAATDFHFTHDVEVTLVWFATEQERYQTHTAADLDNVLKPLLDATTGPDGIMVDDNQVQSIQLSWMTPSDPRLAFTLEVRSLNLNDTVKRSGTAFVEFSRDTCYMLPGEARTHWQRLVNGYRNSVEAKAELREAGIAEDLVGALSPIARPWHTQRLRMQGFEIIHESEFPADRP